MNIKKESKGDVTIINVSGKIVVGEELDKLRNSVLEVLDSGKKNIILNLAEVPYVDSTGLGEIIRSYISVSKKNGSLKLLKISEKIRDLLVISKLITTFQKDIFDNLDEAVASFN
jgi:anti-sigma B factor antagonist